MDDTAQYMPKLGALTWSGATMLPDSAFRYDKSPRRVNFRPRPESPGRVGDTPSTPRRSPPPHSRLSDLDPGKLPSQLRPDLAPPGGIATIESAFVDLVNLAHDRGPPPARCTPWKTVALYGKATLATLVLYLPTRRTQT